MLRKTYMRLGKLVPTLAIVVGSVLLTLIVVFSLDFLAQQVNRLYFGARPDLYVRIPIKEFHHGLAPNKRSEDQWGGKPYTFFTNSLGLRDSRNREVSLQTDRKRILFMGDSFTEGSGVPYEHSFVGQIATKLEPKNIEVLNAGTVSYSALIYWKKIEYLVGKAGLSVNRVVVMPDMGDVYDSTTYALDSDGNVIRRKFLKRVQEFIEHNTIICRQISSFLYGYYARYKYWSIENTEGAGSKVPGSVNHLGSLWPIRDDLYQSYGRVGLETESYNLGQLNEFLKKKGIKLTLAVYPWPDQIWHNDFNSRHVAYWENWARDNKVDFVNLFPAFFLADTNNAREIIERNYIPGDVHWNENGHAAVAEHLLKFLAVED